MNYNMQGMTKMIPELFVMLKSTKKCWWLTRPPVSSKRARERKGTSRRMASKLPLQWRSPKLDPSLKLSASTTKEMSTGSGSALDTWRIRRMAKQTKVYLIYMLLMCTLLVFIANPSVFYTGSVAKSSNSKWELQNKLIEGEVTVCVGSNSKVDMISIAHSLYLLD